MTASTPKGTLFAFAATAVTASSQAFSKAVRLPPWAAAVPSSAAVRSSPVLYRSSRLPASAAVWMVSGRMVPPSTRTLRSRSPPFFIRRVRTALRRLAASIAAWTYRTRKSLPVSLAADSISA